MTPANSMTVNGSSVDLSSTPGDERLLDTLRWRLGLKGTKEGCRSGACGACTVLIGGRSALSCLTLTHEVAGSEITTIEGVAADPIGRKVLAAFESAGAAQCGYCTPGFVVVLTSLLKEQGSRYTLEEIEEDLHGNLCRCTGYGSIRAAIRAAREATP